MKKKVTMMLLIVGAVLGKSYAQIDSAKIAELTKHVTCTIYAVNGDNKKIKLTYETEKNKKMKAKDVEGLVLEYVDAKPEQEKEFLNYDVYKYANQDSLVKFQKSGSPKSFDGQYYACKVTATKGRYISGMCGKILDLEKGEYVLVVYNSKAFVTVKFSLR